MASVFDQLGGEDALAAIVDDFYARVVSDPVLRTYFMQVDLTRLAGHQRAYLTTALGGPDSYSGRPLREAHKNLGITDEQFDALLGHLLFAMTTGRAPASVVGQVAARLSALRDEIVTR